MLYQLQQGGSVIQETKILYHIWGSELGGSCYTWIVLYTRFYVHVKALSFENLALYRCFKKNAPLVQTVSSCAVCLHLLRHQFGHEHETDYVLCGCGVLLCAISHIFRLGCNFCCCCSWPQYTVDVACCCRLRASRRTRRVCWPRRTSSRTWTASTTPTRWRSCRTRCSSREVTCATRPSTASTRSNASVRNTSCFSHVCLGEICDVFIHPWVTKICQKYMIGWSWARIRTIHAKRNASDILSFVALCVGSSKKSACHGFLWFCFPFRVISAKFQHFKPICVLPGVFRTK